MLKNATARTFLKSVQSPCKSVQKAARTTVPRYIYDISSRSVQARLGFGQALRRKPALDISQIFCIWALARGAE